MIPTVKQKFSFNVFLYFSFKNFQKFFLKLYSILECGISCDFKGFFFCRINYIVFVYTAQIEFVTGYNMQKILLIYNKIFNLKLGVHNGMHD